MKEILYDWGGWNVWLFHLINNVHTDALDQFMLLGTRLGDHANFVPYLCGIIVLVLRFVARSGIAGTAQSEEVAKRGLATIAVFVLSYWLQGEIVDWLKTALDFPRPALALQGGLFSLHGPALYIVGTPEYHHSCPSGHSMFAMLLAATFWPLLGRFRFVAAFFVLWVGISRISLGMHFPADVVAGYLVGFAVVTAVRFLVNQAITHETWRLSFGK